MVVVTLRRMSRSSPRSILLARIYCLTVRLRRDRGLLVRINVGRGAQEIRV